MEDNKSSAPPKRPTGDGAQEIPISTPPPGRQQTPSQGAAPATEAGAVSGHTTRSSASLSATAGQKSSGKASLETGVSGNSDAAGRPQTKLREKGFDSAAAREEGQSIEIGLSSARAVEQGDQLDAAKANFEGQIENPPFEATVSSVKVDVIGAAPAPKSVAESTSARLAEDSPSTRDELGFVDYARAIARFLTHPDSKPPLTISIQAPWGGGKTSLMLMIEKELDPGKNRLREERDLHSEKAEAQPSRKLRGIIARAWNALKNALGVNFPDEAARDRLSVREIADELDKRLQTGEEPGLPPIPKFTHGANHRVTVWFNAWKYESTNQVWAGLVDAILLQVPARLPLKERERFWFRLNISRVGSDRVRQKLYERAIDLTLRSGVGLGRAIFTAVVCGAVLLVLYSLPSVSQTIKSILGWTIPVSAIGAFTLVKRISAKFKLESEPVAEVLKDLVDVPRYEQELGFIHQVERDLKRVFASLPLDEGLVIFIDDLDRCSPSKVAAVLEAVNLFLAGDFPKCCFVLGMDTEMVAAALQVAHKDLTANLPGDERTPLGWRFMDKFVQLPFVIPPLANERYQRLMMQILGKREEVTQVALPHGADEGPSPPSDETASFDEEVERLHALQSDTDEFVTLTKEASKVLGGTPRDLKRFVNLLRFNYFLRYSRLRQGLPVPPAVTLGRWTALSVRWPEHVRWLRRVRDRQLPRYKIGQWLENEEELDVWLKSPNHLLLLERMAGRLRVQDDVLRVDEPSFRMDEWEKQLSDVYQLDKAKTEWVSDELLLDFYAESAGDVLDLSLGKHWNTGFW